MDRKNWNDLPESEMNQMLDKMKNEVIAKVDFLEKTSKAGNKMLVIEAEIYDGLGNREIDPKGYRRKVWDYTPLEGVKDWQLKKNLERIDMIRQMHEAAGRKWHEKEVWRNSGYCYRVDIVKNGDFEKLEFLAPVLDDEPEAAFMALIENRKLGPGWVWMLKNSPVRDLARLADQRHLL